MCVHFCLIKHLSGRINFAICAANPHRAFVIGLTNTSPVSTAPVPGSYKVCTQMLNSQPGDGRTYQLWCQPNLPPARYVIMQIPCAAVNACLINIGEMEVYPSRM